MHQDDETGMWPDSMPIIKPHCRIADVRTALEDDWIGSAAEGYGYR